MVGVVVANSLESPGFYAFLVSLLFELSAIATFAQVYSFSLDNVFKSWQKGAENRNLGKKFFTLVEVGNGTS